MKLTIALYILIALECLGATATRSQSTNPVQWGPSVPVWIQLRHSGYETRTYQYTFSSTGELTVKVTPFRWSVPDDVEKAYVDPMKVKSLLLKLLEVDFYNLARIIDCPPEDRPQRLDPDDVLRLRPDFYLPRPHQYEIRHWRAWAHGRVL